MAEKTSQRKVRAVLAGGLVLGIGAAVTLAAWNDSEFAQGTFTSGGFNLVGSADGLNYSDHETAVKAASLDFSVAAGNLAPGDSVDAPFAIRLAAGSTVNAGVLLNTTVVNPNSGLTYSVRSTGAFGCGVQSGAVDLASTALVDGASVAGFDLAKGSDKDTAGTTVNLCFTVTAGDQTDLELNKETVATWQLNATQK